MSTNVEYLATRLGNSLGGAATGLPWLWSALLRLLARGEPVTIEQLTEATGKPAEEVRAGLAALADTEYDEVGRVVGHGITLRPTPHSFEVDGRQLYTWCALDTLIFPAVLDRPTRVSSPCHSTGTLVRVEVDPHEVVGVEPAAAVVSIVTSDGCTSVRSAFCNQVHYFAAPAAAATWVHEHPDATVLPVREAFDLGHRLTQTLLTGPDHPPCC